MPDLSAVKPAQKSLSTVNSVNISAINVKGNSYLSRQEVIDQSNLVIGSAVNELTIKRAKKNIKSLGFIDKIDIIIDSATGVVDIFIEEYPVVTEVLFQGNTVYTSVFLSSFIKIKVGEPYNLKHARADISFIKSQYKKDGYTEATVVDTIKPTDKDGAFVFVIAEGVIEDIQLTGNIKTQDYVILRELDIRPGDIINHQQIKDNLRKIFNLNYFDDIVPEFIPSNQDYHYILKINVVEKEKSGAFTFGGGYQPNSGFNIFSDIYWDNIKGTSQLVMVKGNFGLGAAGYDNTNNTYQIKFHNPWAFGDRRSFTMRLWSSSGSFSLFSVANSNYSFNDVSRRGFDLDFGIPYSYDLRTSHRVKYESVQMNDTDSYYHLYTYKFLGTVDKRDQRENPTTGYYHSIGIEQGFKFKPSAIEMTKIDVTFSRYFSFFKKQVLFLKTTLGYFRSPSANNSDITLDEYYYVGGSRSVRGYADGSPFAYGNKQVIGTAEYRYLFTPGFAAYVFVDVGYATNYKVSDGVYEVESYKDLSVYKLTKGVGVKLVVPPIGPIRLDFGVTEKNIGRLQINLGYSF